MLKIIVLHTPVSPKFLTTVNVMLNEIKNKSF